MNWQPLLRSEWPAFSGGFAVKESSVFDIDHRQLRPYEVLVLSSPFYSDLWRQRSGAPAGQV